MRENMRCTYNGNEYLYTVSHLAILRQFIPVAPPNNLLQAPAMELKLGDPRNEAEVVSISGPNLCT